MGSLDSAAEMGLQDKGHRERRDTLSLFSFQGRGVGTILPDTTGAPLRGRYYGDYPRLASQPHHSLHPTRADGDGGRQIHGGLPHRCCTGSGRDHASRNLLRTRHHEQSGDPGARSTEYAHSRRDEHHTAHAGARIELRRSDGDDARAWHSASGCLRAKHAGGLSLAPRPSAAYAGREVGRGRYDARLHPDLGVDGPSHRARRVPGAKLSGVLCTLQR